MKEEEQSFESLCRLLALKRHEVPPPGYFNGFSRQVLARIRAGEAEVAAGSWERLLAGMPWLVRWLQGLETKPVFAGGFAAALCLLLAFGAVVAQRPESASQALLQPAQGTTPFAATVATGAPADQTAFARPVDEIMIANNSTNPVINFQSPSFQQGQMASPQFASFPMGN